MALPSSIETAVVKGKYKDFEGNPLVEGAVVATFPTFVRVPGDDTILVPREIRRTLDETGAFSMIVPVNNDPDADPSGWLLQIKEDFPGGRTRYYDVPAGTVELDLADVAETLPPSSGESAFASLAALGVETSNRQEADLALEEAMGELELSAPAPRWTVDDILAQPVPFFFNHRGEGSDAPEHTLVSYANSIAHGGNVLEVSVRVLKDGSLVCMHDSTVDRTTYSTGNTNTYDLHEMQRLLTNGRTLLGQGWVDQPVPTLAEVFERWYGKVVIFLEAKGNDAVVPLQEWLERNYPDCQDTVVWKAHIGTQSLPWAKAFPGGPLRTWVYLDAVPDLTAMGLKQHLVDFWGVPTNMSDGDKDAVVAYGGDLPQRPVFTWPVYRRFERDAAVARGIRGIMTSSVGYVANDRRLGTSFRSELQMKPVGGLPTTDYDAAYALKFEDDPNVGWFSINVVNGSYGFGGLNLGTQRTGSYKITWKQKHLVVPAANEHGGLYFGKMSDDAYRFTHDPKSNGYHTICRSSTGGIRIYTHTPGSTSGTSIGASEVATAAIVADQEMLFELHVTPTTVELKRTDGVGWTTGPVADTSRRGAHWGFSNGSISNMAARPFFKDPIVTDM